MSVQGVSTVLLCAVTSRTPAALAGTGVYLLGRSSDPLEAARLVAQHRPQVALVDLDGPGIDVDAVGVITGAAPDSVVLAVAGRNDTAPSVEALAAVRAGATGYIVRPGSAAELVLAVRRTAAGEAVFSPGLADVVLQAHGDAGTTATQLTERESDVLRLVVDGLTARQIATRLVLSPRTVENHVQRVLRKLDLPNRAAMVRYAIENGLAGPRTGASAQGGEAREDLLQHGVGVGVQGHRHLRARRAAGDRGAAGRAEVAGHPDGVRGGPQRAGPDRCRPQ